MWLWPLWNALLSHCLYQCPVICRYFEININRRKGYFNSACLMSNKVFFYTRSCCHSWVMSLKTVQICKIRMLVSFKWIMNPIEMFTVVAGLHVFNNMKGNVSWKMIPDTKCGTLSIHSCFSGIINNWLGSRFSNNQDLG